MGRKPKLDPVLQAILDNNNIKLDKEIEYKETKESTHFRGEGVLYALEYPKSPRVTKVCKGCGDPFVTPYNGVSYCSRECMIVKLRSTFGIEWIPHEKSRREIFSVTAPPAIIPLAAIQAMKLIVAQAEADLGYPLPIPQVQPFVVKYPYFGGKPSAASEEDYKLPASVLLPSSASLLSPDDPQNQEIPLDEDSLDNFEKEAQFQEPIELVEFADPLGDLFADL